MIKTNTFSVIVTDFNEGFAKANQDLDMQVNAFTTDKHWSQIRDIFQVTTPFEVATGKGILISRTVVWATETLASGGSLQKTMTANPETQRQR